LLADSLAQGGIAKPDEALRQVRRRAAAVRDQDLQIAKGPLHLDERIAGALPLGLPIDRTRKQHIPGPARRWPKAQRGKRLEDSLVGHHALPL
jgi:hypothetical protein